MLRRPRSQPYWTGDTAKADAIGYATAQAKFGRGEIQVLNNENSIERVIAYSGEQHQLVASWLGGRRSLR